jgi:hypothetical protein
MSLHLIHSKQSPVNPIEKEEGYAAIEAEAKAAYQVTQQNYKILFSLETIGAKDFINLRNV